MGRNKDIGPYSVGNVKIITAIENHSDTPYKTSGLPVGVAFRNGKYRARKFVGGKLLCIGTYDTPEQAHSAYKRFPDDPVKAAAIILKKRDNEQRILLASLLK